MVHVSIDEKTKQGKGLLQLIQTMPKKVVSIEDDMDDDDLSDCISMEQFGAELKKYVILKIEANKK
ncbi:MAG: hypothetical protein RLZZ118_1923 [Bacteroidota bacterium]|jgi:hypothetical protein